MNPDDFQFSSLIPDSVGFNRGNPMASAAPMSVAKVDPWSSLRTSKLAAPTGMIGGSTGGLGGIAEVGSGMGGSGFGFNMDTGKLMLGGLQTIGSLWNAFQAQKLAKKQFNFQKEITEKNMANQIKTYNTTLADRGRARAAVEGQSPEVAAAYVRDNSLSR